VAKSFSGEDFAPFIKYLSIHQPLRL